MKNKTAESKKWFDSLEMLEDLDKISNYYSNDNNNLKSSLSDSSFDSVHSSDSDVVSDKDSQSEDSSFEYVDVENYDLNCP